MSGNDFRLHVKSTLDKIMTGLVTSIKASTGYTDLQGVEIDNLVQTDEVLKSDKPPCYGSSGCWSPTRATRSTGWSSSSAARPSWTPATM